MVSVPKMHASACQAKLALLRQIGRSLRKTEQDEFALTVCANRVF